MRWSHLWYKDIVIPGQTSSWPILS